MAQTRKTFCKTQAKAVRKKVKKNTLHKCNKKSKSVFRKGGPKKK